MGISGFIIGLVAGLGFIISLPLRFHGFQIPPDITFAPFLSLSNQFSWLNWVNISLGMLGLTFSLIGTIQGRRRGFGIAGIVLCSSVILFGALNLLG